MSVRRAADTDLDAILALEEQGFAARERWSRDSWAGELDADNRTVLVGEVDGAICGVITVQQVGGVAELNRIVVDEARWRTGLGRVLLQAGIAAADEEEAEEMLLEVRHDNAPALALYAAFGFTEIARRNNYYGDGVDAVVMRVELEDDDDSDG
ncbi:MAG: ribosomal protein S18-alanine N-acetyltransferase [Propionibacteriaceae bacterium]|nr:ribosomal protein S18-alanine N-acetyltransferase [Propionibacteriaceae bacterium]